MLWDHISDPCGQEVGEAESTVAESDGSGFGWLCGEYGPVFQYILLYFPLHSPIPRAWTSVLITI